VAQPGFLSPSDIQRQIGVTWLTVYNWITGKTAGVAPLPALKLEQGRRKTYLVSEAVFQSWIAENRPNLLAKRKETQEKERLYLEQQEGRAEIERAVAAISKRPRIPEALNANP